MTDKKLLYQRETVKVYETDSADRLILEFTDEVITEADGKKKIKNKGVMSNAVSSLIFEYLESFHIMTHFISKLSDREMMVKKIQAIPLNLKIKNIDLGDKKNKNEFKEINEQGSHAIEFLLKDENGDSSLINESQIVEKNIVNQNEMLSIGRIIIKTNAVLKSFFERRNIKLVEFNAMVGKYRNKIMLASEISPDNCIFLDVSANEKEDIVYKKYDVNQVYNEIYKKILGE